MFTQGNNNYKNNSSQIISYRVQIIENITNLFYLFVFRATSNLDLLSPSDINLIFHTPEIDFSHIGLLIASEWSIYLC